jgi:hypothetical protein
MKKIVYLLLAAVSLVRCETEENLENDDLKNGELAAAPCSAGLTDNTLVIDSTTLSISPGDVYYTSPAEGGDFHEYRVNLPAPYRILYIRLSSAQPVATGTYTIGESTAAESPEPGAAYLSVLDRTGTFYYSGQREDKIYVTVTDGVPTFELCDVDMFHYATYKFALSGRIGVAPVTEVPCGANFKDNVLTIGDTTLKFTASDVHFAPPAQGGNFYQYRVDLPSPFSTLYIRLSAAQQPAGNFTYAITESTAAESPAAGYAYLSVLDENGIFHYSGKSNDKLYVAVKDGVTTFELCDVDMFHYATYKFGLTGRVVYGADSTERTPEPTPCSASLTANKLTVNETPLTFTSGNVIYSSPWNGGDFHEFRVNLPSPYSTLYVRFSSATALTDSTYYTVIESTAASSPAQGYAYVAIRDAQGTYHYSGLSNDKIYLRIKDGAVTFDICDLDMFYYYTYKFNITGRVVYNP